MIFVTGDTHSDFSRFSTKNFYEQKDMADPADNLVVICGDFGGVWCDSETRQEKHELDWLNSKPFTLVFVPGNHENYKALRKYPLTDFHGAKSRKIRDHIYMIERGEIFTFEGKKFFCFGGAASHDMEDGILDQENWKQEARKLNKLGRYSYRVRNMTWWEEEMPTQEEMKHGIQILEEHDWKVDYVLTHCASTATQAMLNREELVSDYLTDYLQSIKDKLEYCKWFFGHYHDNKNINGREVLLYEEFVRLS